MRYLLTPSPDLHLAVLGALKGGERLWRLAGELFGALGGTARLLPSPGPTEPDPPTPVVAQGSAGLDEERLAPRLLCAGAVHRGCLLYTSDAADERSSVDLGGRR